MVDVEVFEGFAEGEVFSLCGEAEGGAGEGYADCGEEGEGFAKVVWFSGGVEVFFGVDGADAGWRWWL